MSHSAVRPSSSELVRIWARIGVQSFGGGAATLTLIRAAVVREKAWITEEEFTRYWGLVQLAPGINLLGLTVLIGHRIAGARGIALALAGLVLPSGAITLLLTALYARFAGAPAVRSALTGLIPATVGVGLLTGIDMALPPLKASRQEGQIALACALLVLAGSLVAFAWFDAPVLPVLIGSGLFLAIALSRAPRAAR